LHIPGFISDTGISKPHRPLPVVDRQPSTNVGSGSSTSSIFTAAHDEAQDEMHIDDEVLPHEGLDWETHIAQWLSPWDERGITFDQIDLAATALANTTHLHEQSWRPNQTEAWENVVVIPFLRMLPVTFRVFIKNHRMFVEDLHALRPWRDTTPGPKLLILETLKRFPVPDADFLVTQWDNPVVHRHPPVNFWQGGDRGERVRSGGPFPVFSPSTGRDWHDLPYPDFTFMYPSHGQKMGTPGWRQIHSQILEAGRATPFAQRIPRAVFSGNCGQTKTNARPRLKALAEQFPELLFVSDVNKGDMIRGGSVNCLEKFGDPKGSVKGVCSLNQKDLCKFKYLINASAGGSYSGRLKYLFLCGSVVVQVKYVDAIHEFYEKILEPGKHYIVVNQPEDIPAQIQYLEDHPEEAEAIANAGRARIEAMDMDEVARFMYLFLREYSAKQRYEVQPTPNAVEFRCEDDIYRHYKLVQYIHHDNSSCLQSPQPPFLPPGYGGSFDGKGVRCEVEGPPEYPEEFCSCPDDDPLSVACLPGRV